MRYADDCNVYVKSRRAGERVLQALRGCYARLALKVNESKTAVAAAWERKFLGYRLVPTLSGEVKLAPAPASLVRLKHRIRTLTRVTVGRSLTQVAEDLRCYVPGWKAYFRLVQTPSILKSLDQWLRYRLRALQLRQWRHGPTIYREMRQLGASEALAARTAARTQGWWRTGRQGLNRVLTIAYFDQLGVPHFS